MIDKLQAELARHQLTGEIDMAMLKPNFHFVSLIITTPRGNQVAWISKYFPSYDLCFEYLAAGIPDLAKRIPSIEKAIKQREAKLD